MFEVGDIVKYREWSNQPWQEGTWFIISRYETHREYDDVWYTFNISNQKTGEIKTEVCWQQMQHI